eukprot:375759-Pelagomonas_calceolata.AAC.1
MMTVGIGSAHVSAAGEEALVSAAAPVPFEASSSGADLGARRRGVQQPDHRPEQGSAPMQPAANATVTLPIGDLDEDALLRLRRNNPKASITVPL